MHEKKELIKIQVYLTFTLITTIAIYAVGIQTGHFDTHLEKLAEERISRDFIAETIWLVGLIFATLLIGNILRSIGSRKQAKLAACEHEHEGAFLVELADEMPRAAYLVGSLGSSVFYAAAVKVFCDTQRVDHPLGLLLYGFEITCIFGAWGYLLDLVASELIRFVKTIVALLIAIPFAFIAPPFSALFAYVVFSVLRTKFGLDKKMNT